MANGGADGGMGAQIRDAKHDRTLAPSIPGYGLIEGGGRRYGARDGDDVGGSINGGHVRLPTTRFKSVCAKGANRARDCA